MPFIKPKLIDYQLIEFPKKKINPIKRKIVQQDNTKFYINLIMVIILGIGIYLLYSRMINKKEIDEENNSKLLFIHEYINHSLMNNQNYLNSLKEKSEKEKSD